MSEAAHHELTGGLPPQAPSAIQADGLVHRFRKPYDMPEEMSIEDVRKSYANLLKQQKMRGQPASME